MTTQHQKELRARSSTGTRLLRAFVHASHRRLNVIRRRDDFAVFTGTDSMILWTLIAGGDGAVAATTNAVPNVVMSIWNKFQSGDIDGARAAQESLRALRDAVALGTMPVVLKTAAQMLGMPAGPARSPAQPLDANARERLSQALSIYRDATRGN